MTHEMKNIIELNSFKDYITSKSDSGNDGFIFEGFITYEALSEVVTEILEVYLVIGGFEPMIKLDIFSKGRITTSHKYHLDINPKYENIALKHNFDSLIIRGTNSPKLGDYKIIIKEVS